MRNRKSKTSLKKGSILMTLLPLSACGGGGGRSGGGGGGNPVPPAPVEPAEFIENPTNVFIARDDRDTSLTQSGATADLSITGKGGDDVIHTGSGADTINGGGGSDMIRAGEGADNINGGSGNDAIVVVGTTAAGQYTNAAITNSGGSGTNLSNLITLAELNGRAVSEVSAGEIIDGGTGTNTLFIYGTVDLTGVTLNNVTILVVNSDVTLTPDQIAMFTTVDGDGNSVINIEIPPGSPDNYILDLSVIDVADIGAINIDGDITVVIDDTDDLTGITAISNGVGDELILEVSGSGTVNLGDIAGTFDSVDEIELGSNSILNVDDASDVTDLSLSEISGNGDIETDGSSGVDDVLDDLTIAPTVNTVPVANNDVANAGENEIILVDVLANDTDVDGDGLTLTQVSVGAGNGSVSIVGGEVRFNPGTDFDHLGVGEQRQIEVSYTVSDGEATDQGILTITVTGTNKAPTISGEASFAILENQDIIITEAQLIAHATDEENDDLSVINLAVVGGGSIIDNGNGSWTFSPAANTFGDVSLTYDISDGKSSTGTNAGISIEEITFTIPYGDHAGTTLHFNDPLLPFQSNLTGSDFELGAVSHINLVPVWGEYTGAGITLGTPEEIHVDHPELQHAYVPSGDEDPDYDGSYHGTNILGLIAGGTDNGNDIAAMAWDTTISGSVDDEDYDQYDVMTNSEGIAGDRFYNSVSNTIDGAVNAATTGRDGLGTIWINSAGNYANNDHTTDVDLRGAHFEILMVGKATADGYFSGSNYGSALHMVVPIFSYGNVQQGLSIGNQNYSSEYISEEDYNQLKADTGFTNNSWENAGLDNILDGRMGGSSFAAPHVSATAALMLEASEDNIFDGSGLGWRDVQEIFAISSRHTGSALDATEPHTQDFFQDEHFTWDINGASNVNGGGLHFNPDYGFGMLDVHAAVRFAETWQFQSTTGNLVTHDVAFGSGETIEFGTAVEFNLDLTGYSDLDLDVMSLEFGITHDYWPELQITVISPSGMESIILDTGGLTAGSISEFNVEMSGAMDWEVLSRAFWNENTSGTWTIRIEDVVDNGNSGTVTGITAHFEGDVNTDADTYFFTNEWALMNEHNGGVPTLDDNAGVNTINAAPVVGDMTLDLTAGSTSQIGGVDAFSLSGTTTIDIAITGDGDDTIRGLSAGDSVYAMRGDDTIEIIASDFALVDGNRGEDTLVLDGSGINLDLSTDTLTNMEVIDLTGSGNNSVTLTLQDLIDASDEDNQLIIDGDTSDSITSTGEGWVQGTDQNIDGVTYDVYTSGAGTLLVDEDVTQTIS